MLRTKCLKRESQLINQALQNQSHLKLHSFQHQLSEKKAKKNLSLLNHVYFYLPDIYSVILGNIFFYLFIWNMERYESYQINIPLPQNVNILHTDSELFSFALKASNCT